MRTRRRVTTGDFLARGVWVAPWQGPEGELVLLAITSKHTLLVPPLTVPHGASRIDAAEQLLATLERDDHVPELRIIRA